MAIYYTRVKTFSRTKQHSAVAAAAYRGALCLTDTLTGIVHNYQGRSGVQRVICISPIGAPEWTEDPQHLWNAVEAAEKRKDSTLAREFELALPHELSDDQRWELALDVARKLVLRFQFALQVSMHEPPKNADPRHYYAHLLATTRRVDAQGLAQKTRELDGVINGKPQVEWIRATIAQSINDHLRQASDAERAALGAGQWNVQPASPGHLLSKLVKEFESAMLAQKRKDVTQPWSGSDDSVVLNNNDAVLAAWQKANNAPSQRLS